MLLFRYNKLGISLQNGQTFLPTAKLVDYPIGSHFLFQEVTEMYDVLIVGAGPGGIFTAYELLEKRPD